MKTSLVCADEQLLERYQSGKQVARQYFVHRVHQRNSSVVDTLLSVPFFVDWTYEAIQPTGGHFFALQYLQKYSVDELVKLLTSVIEKLDRHLVLPSPSTAWSSSSMFILFFPPFSFHRSTIAEIAPSIWQPPPFYRSANSLHDLGTWRALVRYCAAHH